MVNIKQKYRVLEHSLTRVLVVLVLVSLLSDYNDNNIQGKYVFKKRLCCRIEEKKTSFIFH